MRKVLVLGGRSPVALDHARRFAAQGWQVVIGDSVPCRMASWSRAAHDHAVLPSARYGIREYAHALNRTIETHGIDLVIPTCEEVFYLARVRPALPSHVRVLVDDFGKLAMLHSKWRFLEAARHCGAVVPDSALVNGIDEARDWAGGRPVAIKPEFSRFGVHVRLYPDGVPRDAKPFELDVPWVVQSFCRGQELCSYSVVDRGRLCAHVTYRPSYRIDASSSYVFEICDTPGIEAFVARFAQKIDYTGQLSFDWIVSGQGELQVLECNPRAISGVHLFAPDDALPAALMGEAVDCVRPGTREMRMIAAVMLAAGIWHPLRRRPLREWWRDFRQARDVIAVAGDRMPLLGGLLDLASYAHIAARQRCSMRQASTRDTEWDGEALDTP
ncbi:ATP-grasp domain-containing protein [Rhodanobacter sp. DHB23]|uniref:ATP-grasp domain-containing protein n=1 Tax=Rhodanobacter sp. DHB23 TaxID=2775923 RepID=UPI00177B0BCE|nr:ATP-grasp domain-containing protein [Rhodanobacter sp. DHB23]MBD8871309.1 ATP-grasp domain-containing protein [Rhodanobacter sp. DHB23]